MPHATLGVLPNKAKHLTALRAAGDRHDVRRQRTLVATGACTHPAYVQPSNHGLTSPTALRGLASRMAHYAALPFTLQRSKDVIAGREITSTRETVHGLLRLDGERVLVQWRSSRAIDRVGAEIRSDSEVEPVRELSLPLSALASAEVRSSWLPWRRLHVVLTGADLRAFENLAGMEGLQLKHPAQFEIRVARDSRFTALEFVSELELALAERALHAAENGHLQFESKELPVLERPKNP